MTCLPLNTCSQLCPTPQGFCTERKEKKNCFRIFSGCRATADCTGFLCFALLGNWGFVGKAEGAGSCVGARDRRGRKTPPDLSLLLFFLKQPLHTQLHLSPFFPSFVSFSDTDVHLSVSSGVVGGVCSMVGFHVVAAQSGYASRRAMLQQLHGVTMYSHDEHHANAPYCWSERGKGASATRKDQQPTTKSTNLHCCPADDYTCVCQSVSPSVSLSCLRHVSAGSSFLPGLVQ